MSRTREQPEQQVQVLIWVEHRQLLMQVIHRMIMLLTETTEKSKI